MFFKKKAQPVNEPMDVDAVMKKYDRESNMRIWEGVPKIIVTSILAAFALFCIVSAVFLRSWPWEVKLTSFVSCIVLLAYIVYPARKGKQRVNYMPWYDIVLALLGAAACLYFTINSKAIMTGSTKHSTMQIVIAIIAILVIAEACRRCVGFPILIVAAGFIIYALWGGGMRNPSFEGNFNKLIDNLFYKDLGIFGTPISMCSKFIAVFIIFGAFLERTGIADFFIKIANSIVGGVSGGPAKVAVVASALEGMVSGSSVANTVGSGAVTIPLMKRTGYRPEFAAAAEASASTGGQIMPPIMGAAAFLMVGFLEGTPWDSYSSVVLRAILPALLYFTGVFIAVHLEAKKEGLRGIPRQELPRLRPLLKQIYLLIPLVLLIVLVSVLQNSIQYAAVFAILAAIGVSFLKKETRMTPKKLWQALAAGGQGMIAVATACAVAGIIAGTITSTSLPSKLPQLIKELSGGNVLIVLFLTMICCIILGMGVPTTANFCIMASTCAPILIGMEVPEICAYFFVFYFGIVADLTPPVALASFAGAAIAQANPIKTALISTKLAIGAFIVPYIFVLNPAMMFINTSVAEVILLVVTSFVGMFAVSAGLQGYFIRRMKWYERIVCLAGGLLLIYPGLLTDGIGLALVAGVAVLQFLIKDTRTIKQ